MAAHLSRIWKVCHVSSPNLRFFLTSQVKISCKRYLSHLLWSSEVNCFGKLSICSGIELHVKPPTAWQEKQNQIAAYLISDSKNALQESEDNFKDILDCVVSNVNHDTEYSDVTINIDTDKIERKYQSSFIATSKVLIELPHFYHLDINCSSASKLTVEKIEGDIAINTLGDCVLSQLKSQLLRVHTTQGGITGKLSLIGDMVFTTGNNGHITLDKVQGNNINISCGKGGLRIKSLYGGNTMLSSAFGEVHIGDAHGNVSLTSSDGNVLLGSISGLFKAVVDHGNIDAKLTTGGNIVATSSDGNVTVKIDESLQCHLDLCAKTIDSLSHFNMSEESRRYSDGLVFVSGKKEGIGEQRVRVSCPRGYVKVLNESWTASDSRSRSLNEGRSSKNEDKDFENGLRNVNDVDVCVFTVVSENQKYCEEKSEENLGRLTLLLMQCQIKPKASYVAKCAPQKTLSECTSDMDATDWTTFKTVKKRALTVCQEVRRQLFVLNSQRQVQALLETAQLHTSLLASLKDKNKLLENITSETLRRLRVQRIQFFKDVKTFKKHFIKNESFFVEAAKTHIAFLTTQREIVHGLEKEINILTEVFLQSLVSIQDNFTSFRKKIFEKHVQIMENLNRVESKADKVLLQLEMFKEYGQRRMLNEVLSWLIEVTQSWTFGFVLYRLFLVILVLCLTVCFKMSTSLRLSVLVLMAVGLVVPWNYILLFITLCFVPGALNYLRNLLKNSSVSEAEGNVDKSGRSSSTNLKITKGLDLKDLKDNSRSSSVEMTEIHMLGTEQSSNDFLEVSPTTKLIEKRHSSLDLRQDSAKAVSHRNTTRHTPSGVSSTPRRKCGLKTKHGTPCRRPVSAGCSGFCFLHKQ